jgi:hypothetical protein
MGIQGFSFGINLITKLLFLLFVISFSLTQMYGIVEVILIMIIIILLSPMLLARMKISFTDISPYFFGGVLILGVYGLCLGVFFGIGFDVIFINSKVYFFYPVVGLLIALLVKHFCSLKFIRAVIFASVVMVILINGMAVTQFFFGVDFLPASFINRGMFTVSFYEGRFLLNALNIASIPLLLPFIVYFSFYDMTSLDITYRSMGARLFSYLILGLFVVLIIFSGRRGIWLSSFVSIFFLYIVFISPRSLVKLFFQVISASVVVIFVLVYFDILSFYDAEFDIQSERSIQGLALLQAFYDSPLGNGIGSAFDVVRNKNGWIYELTWHKLLADVGIFLPIFGLCFGSILIAILAKNRKLLAKEEYAFSLLAIIGFGSILLASATNPYILNLDGFIALGFLLGVFDGVRYRAANVSSLDCL